MKSLRNKTIQWAKDNLPPYATSPFLGEVLITHKGINDSLQHNSGPDKLKSIAAIADMIGRGVLVDSGKDASGKPIVGHIIAAKLSIGGQKYIARLVIREDSNGRRFYDHELSDIKKLGEVSKRGAASQSEVGRPTPLRDTSHILQDIYSVNENSVSKAVDENGEPLEVWHGTHRDFETFDRNYATNDRVGLKLDTVGNWFTDSQETARTNYGPKQMPEFLNIKKPLSFIGEGAWKQFRRSVEMEGGVESFRKKAKSEGYDGVQIAGDKIDRAEQTVWITLEPTQIKSATDNNGEFNPEDPNSLHSRASDATGYDAEIDDLISSLTSSGKLDWRDVILEKESARLVHSTGDAFAVPSLASPGDMTPTAVVRGCQQPALRTMAEKPSSIHVAKANGRNATYGAAFDAALTRMGYADRNAAEASWLKAIARASSQSEKFSMPSTASGGPPMLQAPSLDRIAPGGPANARPSSASSANAADFLLEDSLDADSFIRHPLLPRSHNVNRYSPPTTRHLRRNPSAVHLIGTPEFMNRRNATRSQQPPLHSINRLVLQHRRPPAFIERRQG